jgi:hypothetical protein
MFIRPPRIKKVHNQLLKHALIYDDVSSNIATRLLRDAFALEARPPENGCDLIVDEKWLELWESSSGDRFECGQFTVLARGDIRIYLLTDMSCVFGKRLGTGHVQLALMPCRMSHTVTLKDGPRVAITAWYLERQNPFEEGRGKNNEQGYRVIRLAWATYVKGDRTAPDIDSFPERRDIFFDSALTVATQWFTALSETEITPSNLPAVISKRALSIENKFAFFEWMAAIGDLALHISSDDDAARISLGCRTLHQHGQLPSKVYLHISARHITKVGGLRVEANELLKITRTAGLNLSEVQRFRIMSAKEALLDHDRFLSQYLSVTRHRSEMNALSNAQILRRHSMRSSLAPLAKLMGGVYKSSTISQIEKPEMPHPVILSQKKVVAGFNPLLLLKVGELELSVRATNCLKNVNIVYIGEFIQKTEAEMLRIPNFDRKSLDEIKQILSGMGLHLGMDVEDWPLENLEEPDSLEDILKKIMASTI